MSAPRRHGPLLLATAGLLGGVATLLAIARNASDGALVLPLDDAYIHLALAETLIGDGTWGLQVGEHASASSSPAWTALLAVVSLLPGRLDVWSLVLSVGAAVGVLGLADRDWRSRDMPGPARAIGHFVVIGLVPLPLLAGLGMEHTLHALLAVGLGSRLAGRAAVNGGTCLLAALLPLVRYESLFLIGWGALLKLAQGHPRQAARLLGFGSVGVLAFGAWSALQGGLFLPNSLVMKSSLAGGWLEQLNNNVTHGALVWTLISGTAILAALAPEPESMRDRTRALLFGLTALSQMALAKVGWFYRYEGWLLVWGLVWVWGPVTDAVRRSAAQRRGLFALAAMGVLVTSLHRAANAVWWFPRMAQTIHDTDWWIADFLGQHYADQTVAVHDVGALAWTTDVRFVDLAGLADDTVARLHQRGELTTDAFDRRCKESGARVAVVLESWPDGGAPSSWTPVARLHHVGSGRHATRPFLFYAIDPDAEQGLRAALEEAPPSLSDRMSLTMLVDR